MIYVSWELNAKNSSGYMPLPMTTRRLTLGGLPCLNKEEYKPYTSQDVMYYPLEKEAYMPVCNETYQQDSSYEILFERTKSGP